MALTVFCDTFKRIFRFLLRACIDPEDTPEAAGRVRLDAT